MARSAIIEEALALLNGGGAILDVAREVSGLMRAERIEGAVIGGVSVVLHGHVRTTVDVDVCPGESAARLADALRAGGFTFNTAFNPANAECKKHGIPVHLVLTDQAQWPPAELIEIDGIRTVGLADLLNMKLRSAASDPLRAQDLADVIGLIRKHGLGMSFAPRIEKALRPEFRRLAKLVTARPKTRE